MLRFIEFTVINNALDNIFHIIRMIGIIRNNAVQCFVGSGRGVTGFDNRCAFHVVGRKEAEQITDLFNAVFVVFSCKVSYTGSLVVGHSAAQFFLGNFFAGNGFNNCRAGNEHFGSVLYHVDEVGQSRAVYSAACGRTHDSRDLRNNTGCAGVFEEDLAIAAQSVNSFLDTSTAGIIQANARSTHFESKALYFNDFVSMHFAEGAAFNGEVLSEYINQTAVNSAVTGGYTFAREFFFVLAEVGATMAYETIQFNEATFVK